MSGTVSNENVDVVDVTNGSQLFSPVCSDPAQPVKPQTSRQLLSYSGLREKCSFKDNT